MLGPFGTWIVHQEKCSITASFSGDPSEQRRSVHPLLIPKLMNLIGVLLPLYTSVVSPPPENSQDGLCFNFPSPTALVRIAKSSPPSPRHRHSFLPDPDSLLQVAQSPNSQTNASNLHSHSPMSWLLPDPPSHYHSPKVCVPDLVSDSWAQRLDQISLHLC